MPITITITDPTPEQIAALFGTPGKAASATTVHTLSDEALAHIPVDKPKPNPRKKPPVGALPNGDQKMQEPADPEDAALQAELAADVAEAAPEPKGAQVVVDAGTGRPIEQPEVVMTMDMVRANATRLAQSDAPRLEAILGEFGAAKLSEVPADQLETFAGKVLEALG